MTARTKAEALALGLTHYTSVKPCKRGHSLPRPVSTGACPACMRAATQRYRERHPDAVAEAVKTRKGYHKAYAAAWYDENRALVNARNAAWRQANAEKNRQTNAAWKRANLGKQASYTAKRRAMQLQATPRWADMKAIERLYEEAAALRACGVDVHVDHIYPLQGELVCGLHVADNLRLLSAFDNASKGNAMPEGVEPIALMELA